MKYIVMLTAFCFLLVFLLVRLVWEEKKRRLAFEKQLFDSWGKPPTASRKGNRPSQYFSQMQDQKKNRFRIDEITWKELDMEEVYARMDYTQSQLGAEYLYEALHLPAENAAEAARWERTVQYFTDHLVQRVKTQMLLAEIGKNSNMSFLDGIAGLENENLQGLWKEYMADAGYLLAIILLRYNMAMGMCALALLIVYQILSYFSERAKLLPWLRCVAKMVCMTDCLSALLRVLDREVQREAAAVLHIKLEDCVSALSGLKKHSFWILQCARENGSPLSMAGDYLRMLFHPDMIQFLQIKKKMPELKKELLQGAAYTGWIDSCISLAMYRASLDKYCIPCLSEKAADFSMEKGYHPLLKQPVKNSINVSSERGVLLTGSNASGKSTFLKTAAVNLLLAQTVHTALADGFAASISRIYTAMGAGDDLKKGESSYMAEILSLKRILEAEKKIQKGRPILCFVDEILRGTNTVERIAASTQILWYFRTNGIQCFAATHDRELTQLLKADYDNYYFTEEIENGDIYFPYTIRKGSADTSNAIRLLAATGYAPEITAGAAKRAEKFLKERIWE